MSCLLSSESICPLEFMWLMSSLHSSSAVFCQGFLKVLEKPLQQMKEPWQDPALHYALPSIPVVLTISCLLQHGCDFGQQAHSVFPKLMFQMSLCLGVLQCAVQSRRGRGIFGLCDCVLFCDCSVSSYILLPCLLYLKHWIKSNIAVLSDGGDTWLCQFPSGFKLLAAILQTHSDPGLASSFPSAICMFPLQALFYLHYRRLWSHSLCLIVMHGWEIFLYLFAFISCWEFLCWGL